MRFLVTSVSYPTILKSRPGCDQPFCPPDCSTESESWGFGGALTLYCGFSPLPIHYVISSTRRPRQISHFSRFPGGFSSPADRGRFSMNSNNFTTVKLFKCLVLLLVMSNYISWLGFMDNSHNELFALLKVKHTPWAWLKRGGKHKKHRHVTTVRQLQFLKKGFVNYRTANPTNKKISRRKNQWNI